MSNWSLSNTYGNIFVRTAAGRQVIGNKWFFGKNFSFLRWCQSYWRTPIAPFQRQPEPRLLVYLAYMLMAGGAAFAGLRLFELSQGSFVSLQFQGMYAWHTAVNFGLCFIVLDLALDGVCCWCLRPRTVALTWLTGCCSYLIGFALQRTVVYQAIAGYYPDLLLLYKKFPIIRPQATHMFFFCLPFWLLTFCLTVWMIERLQHRFASSATSCKQPATAPSPPDTLQVTTDRGMAFLPMHAITHISMTDHYANIYMQEDDRSRSVFVRMSLHQALAQLPGNQFVRIHRSHLINLHYLVELRRTGRSLEVIIGQQGLPLPVGRTRQRELLTHLHPHRQKNTPSIQDIYSNG